MILGFFQNACILIAFITIGQNIVRNKNIKQSMTGRLIFGVGAGVLGIMLMLNSVQVTNIIIDFRYIPILMASLYGGFLASLISAVIIGMFRLFFIGASYAAINALVVALVIGIGFGLIASLRIPRIRKWNFSFLLLMVTITISFSIALKEVTLITQTLIIFGLGYLIVSFFIIKYMDYIIEMIEIHQKLKNEATKDYLTGLNNVREFDISFNHISQMTLRQEEELSLLLIDIDFFKKVNDTYGHNAGDLILKSLAPILLDSCRTYDIVSRNGGEEFSVLLLDCSSSKAVQIAEKIRKNVVLNDFYISEKEFIKITVSIGISSYPEPTSQIDNLLGNADTALYEAKKSGRNRVALYNHKG